MSSYLKTYGSQVGSKHRLVTKILPLIPPHVTYIEPFGGTGVVLVAKPPSPVEIYNDRDSNTAGFVRLLRNQDLARTLVHWLNNTIYSRQVCNEKTAWLKENFPPIDIVHFDNYWKELYWCYNFYCAKKMSFSEQLGKGFGFTKQNNQVQKFRSSIENLLPFAERIKDVIVFNESYEIFFTEEYDNSDVFLYLDPPYVPETRKSEEYSFEMSTDDHKALVERLLKSKALIMLSGYPSDLYKPLKEQGWYRIDITFTSALAGRTNSSNLQGEGAVKKNQARIETIWMNYDPFCT